MNLSKQARSTLRAIAYWQRQHNGQSPSYAELAKARKVSAASIYQHVKALREDGALKPPTKGWRSLEIANPDTLQSWDQLHAEVLRLREELDARTTERDELADALAHALGDKK